MPQRARGSRGAAGGRRTRIAHISPPPRRAAQRALLISTASPRSDLPPAPTLHTHTHPPPRPLVLQLLQPPAPLGRRGRAGRAPSPTLIRRATLAGQACSQCHNTHIPPSAVDQFDQRNLTPARRAASFAACFCSAALTHLVRHIFGLTPNLSLLLFSHCALLAVRSACEPVSLAAVTYPDAVSKGFHSKPAVTIKSAGGEEKEGHGGLKLRPAQQARSAVGHCQHIKQKRALSSSANKA